MTKAPSPHARTRSPHGGCAPSPATIVRLRAPVGRPQVSWAARLLGVLLIVSLAPAIAACGGEAGDTGKATTTLDVFAAASLTEAFSDMGERFTEAHPGVVVRFNFAGSNDLVTQIVEGAPADAVACADAAGMDKIADLTDGPEVFARNRLAIAVAAGNPKHIRGLADLSRPGLKVVIAAAEVPAGKYAQEILDRAGVTVRPVSLEVSVKGVVTKVSLKEADAGIVYVTDIAAADDTLDAVEIPEDENVVAVYPLAVLASGEQRTSARAFVDFVLSSSGQQVLSEHGFLAPYE